MNYLDARYQIKSQVVEALKALPEKTALGMYYIDTQSRAWIEEAKKSMGKTTQDIGQRFDRGVKPWLCPIQCR